MSLEALFFPQDERRSPAGGGGSVLSFSVTLELPKIQSAIPLELFPGGVFIMLTTGWDVGCRRFVLSLLLV